MGRKPSPPDPSQLSLPFNNRAVYSPAATFLRKFQTSSEHPLLMLHGDTYCPAPSSCELNPEPFGSGKMFSVSGETRKGFLPLLDLLPGEKKRRGFSGGLGRTWGPEPETGLLASPHSKRELAA